MKEKQGGKIFLVVSILFLLFGGVVTVYAGFEPDPDRSLWFPLIFLATMIINVYISMKESRPYYTMGFSLMAVSSLLYMVIPYLI
ncbi:MULTISPECIES: hypothetical protein [Rossellomorea]|uniref:hypothetical protein n=1 Tax=Rossellomorea TaxID=2837508 RepID=UPI001CCB8C2C|nr:MULTISPECIES: hypothetical protein [Rossellomorea]MCA0149304.1 hypothetical protein [Rossellomorea vietnamensis]UTE78829.1 hypothetical protein M1J35_08780 [Rossellomorea sp. KS-H15a]WGG46882.1 hypothetical protein P8596_06590 [Rossellomorea sp. DA94]